MLIFVWLFELNHHGNYSVLDVNKLITKLCNSVICRAVFSVTNQSPPVSRCSNLCGFLILFSSLILPTVWLPCRFPSSSSSQRATLSGLSSSWQSLLLLLYVHHPPTLLPPAALCQPCCSGAAFTTPSHSVSIPVFLCLSFLFGFNLQLFYSITSQIEENILKLHLLLSLIYPIVVYFNHMRPLEAFDSNTCRQCLCHSE